MLEPPQRSDKHRNTKNHGHKSHKFVNSGFLIVDGGCEPEVSRRSVEALVDLIAVNVRYRKGAQANLHLYL